MKFLAFTLCCVTYTALCTATESKTLELDAVHNVSDSLNNFAVQLLGKTAKFAGSAKNLALSPYTVWSLLSIISEGARGNTAKQLERALNIPPVDNRRAFRRNYKSLTKYLTQKTEGIEMEITNAIFTTSEYPINQTFQQLAQAYYGVDVIPVNFKDTARAVDLINTYIKKATKNRIPYFADTSDVTNAQIFITSALYFKGQWTLPFNASETLKDDFFDEKRNKIGQVMMMYREAPFPYAAVDDLKAHVVQLSYGKDAKVSMFVVLPYIDETLTDVLNRIASFRIAKLIQILDEAREQYLDEDVRVYLPRFKIVNDFNLDVVLDEGLGIADVFNSEAADLLGIFPHYTFVSRIIQKAEIEVNEEGTVASAVSGASIIDKTTPPKFLANRPFAYIIVDHETKSIVFIGKVYNPNKLR